ncbi:hypothetical protein CAPTEDRAFT_47444, partial [Capitella teleta]
SGTLVSPNYPYPYATGLRCLSIIRAPKHSFIMITFEHMDIEDEEYCLYDWLKIVDLDRNISAKHCGKIIPADLLMDTTMVEIRFFSDNAEGGVGYKLNY